MRRRLLFLCALGAVTAWPAGALAAPPDTATVDTTPVDTAPIDTAPIDTAPIETTPAQPVATVVPASGSAPGDLIIVPAGCASPPAATAVFAGTLQARGADSARFSIEQVRAGSLDEYRKGDLVDVGFGGDVRYLADGEEYVVGVTVDPASNSLVSKVREPTPLFGGDAVIGINDSDVSCPILDDPVRTLHADGTAVDVGVLTPLSGAKRRVLRAVLLPVALAFGLLVVLAAVKLLGQAAFRSAISSDETLGPPRQARRHAPR